MTERVAEWAESVYRSVAIVAEVSALISSAIDKAAVAVQESIEHLQEVYPDVFSEAEPVEKEEPYTESVNIFDSWLAKEAKIVVVQEYLSSKGYTTKNSVWFDNLNDISDRTVNETYRYITGVMEREKEVNGSPGPVDRFNPINYWNK